MTKQNTTENKRNKHYAQVLKNNTDDTKNNLMKYIFDNKKTHDKAKDNKS